MSSGEKKGWDILANLEPDDVCKRSLADFDEQSGLYKLKSFGMDISIAPRDKNIFSHAPESEVLLKRLGYFSHLAILWYLISAKDISLSGHLIKPVNLKGGHLFFRGTHILPCDKVARKYSDNSKGFLTNGKNIGGEQLRYGDASVRLSPFPRVPVVLILWQKDEEFPERVDVLFDGTCEFQLPLDILWSTAMMSLLIML
jgi:hypothetical protein